MPEQESVVDISRSLIQEQKGLCNFKLGLGCLKLDTILLGIVKPEGRIIHGP